MAGLVPTCGTDQEILPLQQELQGLQLILDEVLDHRDRRRQSPKAHSAVALFLRAGSASKVHPYDIQQAFWINELFLNRKDTAPPSTQNTRSKWDDLTAGLQRLSGQSQYCAATRQPQECEPAVTCSAQELLSEPRTKGRPSTISIGQLHDQSFYGAAQYTHAPQYARHAWMMAGGADALHLAGTAGRGGEAPLDRVCSRRSRRVGSRTTLLRRRSSDLALAGRPF